MPINVEAAPFRSGQSLHKHDKEKSAGSQGQVGAVRFIQG
jgi:hypothetical protein